MMTEAEKAEYDSLLNLNGDGVMGYIGSEAGSAAFHRTRHG
ncbi:MAG: hypothetical protein ACLS6G_08480 [Christensenellales bacterium]